MKRARFIDPAGSVRIGDWRGDEITAADRTHAVDEVDVLAPVEPEKVLGIGYNYKSRFDSPEEYPDSPRLWWKGGPNVVSGPGDTVSIPEDGEVVYEAELGVVIGEQCRNVTEEDASDVIAGYTCVNDLSDQAHPDDPTMFRTKSFDNAAPMGPVVAPPERVPDTPRIRLWVNDERKQDSAGDEFVYTVPEVVSRFSKYVTLEPDDVIMMGNPGDFEPLEDGDRVEIEVEGVGRLEHDVATTARPL